MYMLIILEIIDIFFLFVEKHWRKTFCKEDDTRGTYILDTRGTYTPNGCSESLFYLQLSHILNFQTLLLLDNTSLNWLEKYYSKSCFINSCLWSIIRGVVLFTVEEFPKPTPMCINWTFTYWAKPYFSKLTEKRSLVHGTILEGHPSTISMS